MLDRIERCIHLRPMGEIHIGETLTRSNIQQLSSLSGSCSNGEVHRMRLRGRHDSNKVVR